MIHPFRIRRLDHARQEPIPMGRPFETRNERAHKYYKGIPGFLP